MRAMLVAAVLIGCGGNAVVIPPDARPSGLDVPIGQSCEAGLCGRGAGACVAGACRSQCSAVDYPRCPSGLAEEHVVDGSGDLCVCVPR